VRGFDGPSQAVPADVELRSRPEPDCFPLVDFDDLLEVDVLEVFDEPDDPDLADPDESVAFVLG
jgi:hypothetical protein